MIISCSFHNLDYIAILIQKREKEKLLHLNGKYEILFNALMIVFLLLQQHNLDISICKSNCFEIRNSILVMLCAVKTQVY